MPFFHCSSTILESGSVIRPRNWGRIIRNCGWAHTLALREAAVEYVRRLEFSDKPSRLLSTFFFDDEKEARFYAISDGRQTTMIVYEVELIEPGATCHIADWRSVAPRGGIDLEWAREYWLGTFQPPHQSGAVCRELVAITPVKVLRQI